MKVYVPPLKIQGIKTKLVPLISEYAKIDKNTLWIEPFMGSGVVGFNLAGERAIFADLNPHVINFYNAIKNSEITSELAADFLRFEGEKLKLHGGDYFLEIRRRFNDNHSPLDFLFLNRSCFNGMIRFNRSGKFNTPYGHKPERFAQAYITKISNQIKYVQLKLKTCDWEFICAPFEKTIALTTENSFVYCDPPYVGRHVDYYDSWNESDEIKLRDMLFASGAKFLLSTWNGNKYRENLCVDTIWSSCNKVTSEHFYFVGAKEENRNSMTEALLANYSLTKPKTITKNATAPNQVSLAI